MRGKVFPVPPQVLERRITPAYAGKSSDVFQKIPLYKDHPRLCGEKMLSPDFKPLNWGSPPPMRGKGQMRKLPKR